MDASTRLYARLGEIPEDPNDPESLAELLVCAFGAFERYYVCWKTAGGDYRQDGYDLPPALRDWLYPSDGTTRDFATLQVVFGRGEEYFASDKDGKLEYKEPEPAKPVEPEVKSDKMSLRRSRTVSFLRPLSEVSTRSDTSDSAVSEGRKRSSSTSSRRVSRPPSLSYSRTNSDASLSLHQINELPAASLWQSDSALKKEVDFTLSPTRQDYFTQPPNTTLDEPPGPTPTARGALVPGSVLKTIDPPIHDLSNFKIPEGYILIRKEELPTIDPTTCTCGCHEPPLPSHPPVPPPKYTHTSVQTDALSPPPRSALRIDTTAPALVSSTDYSIVSQDDESPMCETYPAENPIFMGRMMNYFSKPGYQLGDSLMSGYHGYQQDVYEYQDEFEEEDGR